MLWFVAGKTQTFDLAKHVPRPFIAIQFVISIVVFFSPHLATTQTDFPAPLETEATPIVVGFVGGFIATTSAIQKCKPLSTFRQLMATVSRL